MMAFSVQNSVKRVSMRSKAVCCALILVGLSHLSVQASSADDPTYVAGVVEFQPAALNQPSADQLNDNLRGYLDIILSAEAAITDIIVFPELTLNNELQLTFVPDPKHNITPCNNNDYEAFLQELSCAVKSVQKYVVINLLEKEICTNATQAEKSDPRPCSTNGLNSFNTNVVFDRDGKVISRYRKYNVYGEPRNVTYLPELSTFKTDFGVEFGQFICFDINFYDPAMQLVKLGIKDIIFNAFWYSELPFLTSVQLHQSWAYANEVNLLAAGGSYPIYGTTGSGIYSAKKGTLISVMATEPERKLYVANVTKSTHWNSLQSKVDITSIPTRRSLNGLKLMREYKMDAFTSQHLDITAGIEVKKQVCHETFCCNFTIKVRQNIVPEGSAWYEYHLAAFDGDRQYSGNGYTKYRLCAVYACTNKTLESCGRVFDDSVDVKSAITFETLDIEANFPKAEKVLIMPNSVDRQLNPFAVNRFTFSTADEKQIHRVQYKLVDESDDLLTFGIYANYYDGKSSSNVYFISSLTMALCVILVFFFNFKISWRLGLVIV